MNVELFLTFSIHISIIAKFWPPFSVFIISLLQDYVNLSTWDKMLMKSTLYTYEYDLGSAINV